MNSWRNRRNFLYKTDVIKVVYGLFSLFLESLHQQTKLEKITTVCHWLDTQLPTPNTSFVESMFLSMFLFCFTVILKYKDILPRFNQDEFAKNNKCGSAVFVSGLFSLSALSGFSMSDVYSAGIDLILRSSPQTQ